MKKVRDRLAEDERRSKEKTCPRTIAEEQHKVKVPTPAEKHVYCGVCFCNYEDYFHHIQSMGHTTTVAHDALYQDIDELIEEFDLKHQHDTQAKIQQELERQLGDQESATTRKIIRIKSQFP